MAFCNECGFSVAPDDIFCPNCGIALPQTAPVAASPEPAKTPENITETQGGQSSSAIENEHSPVSAPSPAPENQDLISNNDQPNVEKSEKDEDLSKFAEDLLADEDFVIPAIENQPSEIKNESANLAEIKTEISKPAEDEFSDVPKSNVTDAFPPASFENNSAGFNDLTEQSDAVRNEVESSEPKDLEKPLDVNKKSDEIAAPFTENEAIFKDSAVDNEANPSFDDSDFTLTIPYLPGDSAKFLDRENLNREVEEIRGREEEKDVAPIETAESAVETSAQNESAEQFAKSPFAENDLTANESSTEIRENQAYDELMIEPAILKPDDNLSSHVSDPPNSQFDSVRIMESPVKDTPKIENTPFETAPVGGNAVQDAPIVAAPTSSAEIREEKPPATNEPAIVPKTSTSPNIGGSDSDNKKAAKLKPLDEGTVLNNRYEIIRKIGGGGMGAVYLASDNNLGGVLRAVKEMVQSYIEETQQDKAINDFKRESMILSTLDHVSIPTIYDYFYDEKESRFYLVMKYINGGDLSAKLRSTPAGKIDEKSITEWGIQVADVLDYLHNRPTTIVYRDLKPANLMIDGNSGRIMLIDFGIARSVNKEEKGVTAVGTMGYAPPELFSGNVEPRSDIYSLGSTMFHLLTGADPQSNPLLIFDFQKNPRPRQINSQLSDQMERILMRAVEYNADARFASAAELRQALQEHFDNLKIGNVTYGVKEAPKAVSLENQPVFCGFCGQRIMATDMFCAFCGAKQPLSQQGVHSEIYSNIAVSAKVMIVGTNELDSPIFDLDKDVNLIGRRDPMSNIFPEVDLSRYDPQTKISRRHALIKSGSGGFTVEDLGSSNGTMIIPAAKDSVRLLPHQPHLLSDGDKIRVGDTTLNFFLR